MPAALDVPWDVIRLEFAAGISLSKLGEKYGLPQGTLAARSARENWVDMRPETHVPSVQSIATAAAVSQSGTLLGRGMAYRERLFAKVSGLVDQATLAPPKSWKDLEVADKIAGRAAGLDNGEQTTNIQMNMWQPGQGPETPSEISDFDTEVVEIMSEE